MRVWSLLVLVALVCCRSDAASKAPSKHTLVANRAPGLHSLNGLEWSLADDDLEPLGRIAERTSIVALGESVHMSDGYAQIRARATRYLVEKLGFRLVALETDWVAARRLEDFLLASCEGDILQQLRSVNGVWASEATRNVVAWLCEFNKRHPNDRVHFAGFDVQQPWDDTNILREIAPNLPGGPSVLISIEKHCDGAWATSGSEYYNAEPAGRQASPGLGPCLLAIEDMRAILRSSPRAVAQQTADDAKAALISLEAWVKTRSTTADGERREVRDQAMADVLELQRNTRFGGSKTIVWAHNLHIAERGELLGGNRGGRNMGTFLGQRLASKYVPIGLVGYSVEVNRWPGAKPAPGLEAVEDVYRGARNLFGGCPPLEEQLHEEGHRFLLLDLKKASDNLSSKRREVSGQCAKPGEHFRALLYVDHSAPMQALFW
jgi:erythromycin esterase